MRAVLYHARLLVDLWSIKLFVWLLGTKGELLDSHLFFYVRYSLLADHHRENGREARASHFEAIADAHFQAAPDDGGPDEAAMAMPIPRPPVFTTAVSDRALEGPKGRRTRTPESHDSPPPHPRQPIHAH